MYECKLSILNYILLVIRNISELKCKSLVFNQYKSIKIYRSNEFIYSKSTIFPVIILL